MKPEVLARSLRSDRAGGRRWATAASVRAPGVQLPITEHRIGFELNWDTRTCVLLDGYTPLVAGPSFKCGYAPAAVMHDYPPSIMQRVRYQKCALYNNYALLLLLYTCVNAHYLTSNTMDAVV